MDNLTARLNYGLDAMHYWLSTAFATVRLLVTGRPMLGCDDLPTIPWSERPKAAWFFLTV